MFYHPIFEVNRINGLLEELMERGTRADYSDQGLDLSNAYENDKGYMVQFLAPGVKPENISVDLADGILSVKVQRPLEKKDSQDIEILIGERSPIDFTRKYRLPDNVDADQIDAKLANGMLMVYAPKSENAKPRKISVKVN